MFRERFRYNKQRKGIGMSNTHTRYPRVCHSESAHESQTFFGAADVPPPTNPPPRQIFTSFCCISNPIVLLLVSNKGVRYFRASFFIIKVYFDINQ